MIITLPFTSTLYPALNANVSLPIGFSEAPRETMVDVFVLVDDPQDILPSCLRDMECRNIACISRVFEGHIFLAHHLLQGRSKIHKTGHIIVHATFEP